MSIPWEFLLQHSNPHAVVGEDEPVPRSVPTLGTKAPVLLQRGGASNPCTAHQEPPLLQVLTREGFLAFPFLTARSDNLQLRQVTHLPPKAHPQVFKEWMLLPKGSLKPGLVIQNRVARQQKLESLFSLCLDCIICRFS